LAKNVLKIFKDRPYFIFWNGHKFISCFWTTILYLKHKFLTLTRYFN
jgi:hypothetical protein